MENQIKEIIFKSIKELNENLDEDQKMREQVKRERTLLIQKLLKPKDKAPKGPEAS